MKNTRILIVCRRAPYGSGLAKAGLDVVLATAVFDLPVSVLFSGEGVLQLLPQDAEKIGEKNIEKTLDAFPLYDINKLFVDSTSLTERGLAVDALRHQPTAIDDDKLALFYRDFDIVLNF